MPDVVRVRCAKLEQEVTRRGLHWRHSPNQIIRKRSDGNRSIAGGAQLDEVCRHLQIAESNWHRWLALKGGMKASDAKHLKELEGRDHPDELDKARLTELAMNTSDTEASPPCSREAVPCSNCPTGQELSAGLPWTTPTVGTLSVPVSRQRGGTIALSTGLSRVEYRIAHREVGRHSVTG